MSDSSFNHKRLTSPSNISEYISYAVSQICSCRSWHRSVPHLHLSFPLRASRSATRLETWRLWGDGIENIEWLELLLPFTAVKNLYLSKRIAPRVQVVAALQETDYWGRNNRSVVQPAEALLGGVLAIGTCPGGHCAVHFGATVHQSPCRHFCLGYTWCGTSRKSIILGERIFIG
jgi:hypothetical protein